MTSATVDRTATAYQPVIGIEVHVQLSTNTKMFCGCKNAYGEAPNTLTCPVCQGQPGALPVVNKRAIEFGIRIGLALQCQIARHTHFDRKNYFYPDLPKGYQISQYDEPLNYDGELELPITDVDTGALKRVGIERAHMEEDTGKSIHMDDFSLLDYNRAGAPLCEIVTTPCMHSSEEAYQYLVTLKRTLSYLSVSGLNMEKGQLRCDLNVSLRQAGTAGLPDYKVEVKNLNSFSAAKSAIEHEIARQAAMLDAGTTPVVETRLWDEDKLETRAMRSKELANDYRYFPEPDLPALTIEREWVAEIKASLPEMPDKRLARMLEEYKLRQEDAEWLVDDRERADFYEASVALYDNPKKVASWIIGEVGRALNEQSADLHELKVIPEHVAETLKLLEAGKLNNITAKEVFADVIVSGDAPEAVAKRLNKLIEQDDAGTDAVIDEVLAEFDKAVAEYREGKGQALGFLIGQCMRKLRGKANPKDLQAKLKSKLDG